MCGIIILLSIGIAVWDLWTRAEVKKKARHITIALATFSEDGRILVKTDGTIPVQAIETKAELSVSQGARSVLIDSAYYTSLTPEDPSSNGYTNSPSTGQPFVRLYHASSTPSTNVLEVRLPIREPLIVLSSRPSSVLGSSKLPSCSLNKLDYLSNRSERCSTGS
jgi:hypothetical protein